MSSNGKESLPRQPLNLGLNPLVSAESGCQSNKPGSRKIGQVVHSAGSSILCVSASATPLNMSAAVSTGSVNVRGLAPLHGEPFTAGETQPVCTAFAALQRDVLRPHSDCGDSKITEKRCSTLGDTPNQNTNGEFADEISPDDGISDEMESLMVNGLSVAKYVQVEMPEFDAVLHKAVRPTLANGNPLPPALDKPHVLVVILGGTICMDYAYKHCCLRPSRLAQKMTEIVEFKEPSLPFFDLLEWNHLVDSSDLENKHYSMLAKQIEKFYGEYDGFIILHGTDTMAYTAAVLSFMLENVGKTVALTGSMLPMMHISSDAKRNVGLSLMVAGYSDLTEVVVVFGSQVLRGTRVVKSDCSSIDAFSSPNFPAIGSIGVDVIIHDVLRAKPPARGFRVFTDLACSVCVLTLTPTTPVEIIECVMSNQSRPLGVVLQLFGSGTAPSNRRFLDAIKNGLNSGIAVVASTQCLRGSTNLLVYENGVWISALGVISAKDMTIESVVAKLSYLLGKGYKGTRLKELMETNMRGELTESPNIIQSRADAENLGVEHSEVAQAITRGMPTSCDG